MSAVGRACGAAARGRARARGVTLIEILITIAIVTVMTGIGFVGMGALSGARLKRSTTLVASAAKVAYGYANSSSKTVRLVFDFDEQKIYLQQSSERHFVEKGSRTGGAEGATELEKEAQAAATALRDGPRAPRASFEPARALGFGEEGKDLPTGVRFWQVHTAHQDEPISDGRAYLYFFPGGLTENASIQLKTGGEGGDEGDFMSVLIAPLTGRATIAKGRLDMPEPRDEEEASERDDNGT